jgi:hypothetical protein
VGRSRSRIRVGRCEVRSFSSTSRGSRSISSFVATVFGVAAAAHANPFDDAARDTIRVRPRAAHVLPKAIATRFERMGCMVPQPFRQADAPATIDNVIRGHFARRGQTDYALLCSIDGRSRIEVIWGGAARCAALEDSSADVDWVQAIGPGPDGQERLGYSRRISSASQEDIAYFRDNLGGRAPPDRTHHGIDDSFMGKGSTIHYCARGRWTALQGMD